MPEPHAPALFRRTPLAVACAIAFSGNCLAQSADLGPSVTLRHPSEIAARNAERAARGQAPPLLAQAGIQTDVAATPAPDETEPKLNIASLMPQRQEPPPAGVPAPQSGAAPLLKLRLVRELAPTLKIAGAVPNSALPAAPADHAPYPALRLALALAPPPRDAVEPALRGDGPPVPGQTGVPDPDSEVSAAAAPRRGSGVSALKAAPEPLRLAQAQGLPANTAVAAAAAPLPGQGESALVGNSSADVPRPKRNRASATANLELAQEASGNGKRNGNGKGNGEAEGTGLSLWKIPPIRWGGDVSFHLNSLGSQGAPRTTTTFESLGFRAASYVYQPWFAQVSAALRLMQTNAGLTKGLASEHTGSTTVNGNGSLALFPVSRFPFGATYDKSDTRTSGELIPNGYTSERLGLRQSYTPLTGNASYQLSFDRSAITSTVAGTDIAKSLVGTMRDRIGLHAYDLYASSYSNSHSNTGDNSQLYRFNANHNYRPGPTFSLDNMANLGASDYHYSSSGVATDNRDRYLQLNSFGTWRPGETSPLLMTGGARLYQSRSEASGTGNESRTVSGNVGATYTLSRNTVLTGSGVLTQTSSGGQDSTVSSVTAGAGYTADPIRWRDYMYRWNTGVNASRTDATGQESKNLAAAKIGHSLNRSITLAPNSFLRLDANQTLSKNTGALAYQTLVSSGAASWSLMPSDTTTSMLAAMATDSRNWGANTAQHFQMLNLQANGQARFGRFATGGANLTIQGTRQTSDTYGSLGTPAAATSGFSWSTNGGLNYQHMQAFGVPRLRYTALFNANQFQNRARFEGDVNAPVARINKNFEQRLDYTVGRTEMQLLLRFAEVEGKSSNSIFFRIIRPFGNY